MKQRLVMCKNEGCELNFWAFDPYVPCPACGVAAKKPEAPRRAPAVRGDLPGGKMYIGPKAQNIRSRYHLSEVMKSESDRTGRDIRTLEG